MNILVPDSVLRQFLQTTATAKELKEYLSLCGPSVERVNHAGGDTIYDIEITTNRPDSMSVVGIAREAAAILPRFGKKAKLVGDPYALDTSAFVKTHAKEGTAKLSITTNTALNPRFTAIVFDNVTVGKSPAWLTKALELSGIRSINNVIDITNYIMRIYGQPVHAFDYDDIAPKKGMPTMTLRASKKGEKLQTLDGKTHTLPGDDIVIEDGSGSLIDLCGIMGGKNSAIKDTTKRVVLFMQTYDAAHIRKTSMKLAHRTEAAALFEKDLDPELVLPAFVKGTELMEELAGAKSASRLYDIYPYPYKPNKVAVSRTKTDAYLGTRLPTEEITAILTSLGFTSKVDDKLITVSVPSFRRDVTIDVDIIEELARIYGYHTIGTRLPETEPPMTSPDPVLVWEEEVKTRLRDWGYTETYTYSMISEELMDAYALPKNKAYTITNPLSSEWVYMRPSLIPSMLAAVEQNLHNRTDFQLFELSMIYQYREGDLPREVPMLCVAYTGERFRQAKGLVEALFALFGIPQPAGNKPVDTTFFDETRSLSLGEFGSVGIVRQDLPVALTIKRPVTLVLLDFGLLVSRASRQKTYIPISRFPPVIEDLSFVLSRPTTVGAIMDMLTGAHAYVQKVELLDMYERTRTFRITYASAKQTLTADDIRPVREHLVQLVRGKLSAALKTA